MKLTAGDVCEIAGIPRSSLDRWVLFGLIEPNNRREGKGTHRVFSISQCIAIAAAARYRQQGATFDRVAGLIQYLAKLPLEHLEAEIEAGRTFPVPATMLGMDWLPGVMIEPPKLPRSSAEGKLLANLDLARTVTNVKKEIQKRSRKQQPRSRGRCRGLASV